MTGKSHAHSPKKIYSLTPLAAAVVAALSPTLPVLAQEEATRLEEVIVTATKREINLQDVPHNIDVLSSEQLRKMGAKSLEDALKGLPSISMNNTVPGRTSLVVRGISTGGFEYRTDSQVAVYLDEQPMTTNSQQVGIRAIDMERIETLAGPQGTLFGSSSQTGTLRYITNKPNTNGVVGGLEARYGNTSGGDDSYDISGFVNIPLVEDKFAVRLVAYTSHDGGWIDNVLGSSLNGNFDNAAVVEEHANEYDTDGGRIAALWNMGDRWSLLAALTTEQTHAEGSWENDPELGDYEITRFVDENRDDDWYSAALTLNGDLGFAELSMTVTRFDRDIAYHWDNNTYSQYKDRYYAGAYLRYTENCYATNPNYGDYSCYLAGYYAGYTFAALYYSDYYHSTTFNDQTQERDTLEVRLTSTGDSKLRWTVGAFYEDVYDEWYYGTNQPGLENTTMWAYANYLAYYYGVASNSYNNYTPNTNISYPLAATDDSYTNTLERSVKQIAVFAEASYDFTDKWTLLGGFRWAEYDRDEFSRFAFPEGLPAGDRGSTDGSFRSMGTVDDTIYKISLNYNLNDDSMIYGLYSQGFRLGGINSPRAAITGRVPLEYQPDYLDNYEFGIKSRWLDNRLTINADFFLMEWSDYQYGANPGAWWLRGTVNARTAETKGVEVQVNWQATDRLLLTLDLFNGNPEFTEDFCNDFAGDVYLGCVPDVNGDPVYASDGGGADIVAGMPMPGSPESKYFVSAYYEVPDVFGGEFYIYFDYAYQSDTWNKVEDIVDNNTNGLAPSWTYSTLKFGLNLPSQFGIDLQVRNLFDEKGYTYVATSANGYADLFGDARWHDLRSQSRPRTVWLSLRKDFGGG